MVICPHLRSWYPNPGIYRRCVNVKNMFTSSLVHRPRLMDFLPCRELPEGDTAKSDSESESRPPSIFTRSTRHYYCSRGHFFRSRAHSSPTLYFKHTKYTFCLLQGTSKHWIDFLWEDFWLSIYYLFGARWRHTPADSLAHSQTQKPEIRGHFINTWAKCIIDWSQLADQIHEFQRPKFGRLPPWPKKGRFSHGWAPVKLCTESRLNPAIWLSRTYIKKGKNHVSIPPMCISIIICEERGCLLMSAYRDRLCSWKVILDGFQATFPCYNSYHRGNQM